MPNLDLRLLDGRLAVCRLAPGEDPPAWVFGVGGFWSVTRTATEWSVVCAEGIVPAGVRSEAGWRILQVAGPLDFGLTGILASIAVALAEAGISIFALSTYDTDYVMVKEENVEVAVRALEAAGHRVER